jgi:hypothetical protein
MGQVASSVREAETKDRFMVAVWSVDEMGEVVCRRTTWQFPIGNLQGAVKQLADMIGEELNPTQVPLPMANFLKRTNRRYVERAEVDDGGEVLPIDAEDNE